MQIKSGMRNNEPEIVLTRAELRCVRAAERIRAIVQQTLGEQKAEQFIVDEMARLLAIERLEAEAAAKKPEAEEERPIMQAAPAASKRKRGQASQGQAGQAESSLPESAREEVGV